MTSQIPAPPPFETRCPRCKVSYPIEQRRCIHCGGPTERPAPGPSAAAAQPMRRGAVRVPAQTRAPTPARAPARTLPRPIGDTDADDEAEPPSRGFTRGIGLLWIALALAASLYRACTGSGGPG